MTKHDCSFAWCTNPGTGAGDELEHCTDRTVIPCTGIEPADPTMRASIACGLWFNEDTDASPHVYIEADEPHGNVGLTLPQAIRLHRLLGDLITAGIAGTKLDPASVIGEVNGEVNGRTAMLSP